MWQLEIFVFIFQLAFDSTHIMITTVPSELGYGDRGAGARIPGGSVLVFTLELLKVTGDYVKADM